ncbi:ECF RNA polymerase sigma factor SigW [Planctomycetales bacterium 10988]|nr:ECF RNA polymerase sigma factor SigW [Planctomycetales bacterium 10988]
MEDRSGDARTLRGGKDLETMDGDDELMCRLQGGDERAFEELVERHREGLRNFFLVRSPSVRARQMADDLAQETLLRIYNQAWDFLPQGRFKAWMYRIARNLLIDSQRRESYDALIGAREGGNPEDQLARLVSGATGIPEMANHHAMGDLIAELLADLPEEQRLTFQAHHFLGLSLPEVAEVMETSTATTKSRLRLAREKLRDQLQIRGITAEDAKEE